MNCATFINGGKSFLRSTLVNPLDPRASGREGDASITIDFYNLNNECALLDTVHKIVKNFKIRVLVRR